ncbi:MAG: hypothetical protein HY901_01980, partial [Deltaproteobacteria bacterium]|nr:hypothetical protein [Deltaproteobacteria bacterium]
GDSHLNTAFGEMCDGGGDTATCDADCTAPSCGDSHLNTDAGELCDEGGVSATCDVDCTPPACGDGLANALSGEECDGSDLVGEDCVSLNFVGGSLGCNADCSYDVFSCVGPPGCAAFGTDGFGYQGCATNPTASLCDDISATGTSLALLDDNHLSGLPIGFPFDFYGTVYTTASVGSNGLVYFPTDYLGLNNVCIPGTPGYSVTTDFIAANWDDLDSRSPDAYVKYQTLGTAPNRRFVVEFNTRDCCGGTSPLGLFRVVLLETSNHIRVCYENMTLSVDATAGIQHSPTVGLGYSCNAPNLISGRIVEYDHP